MTRYNNRSGLFSNIMEPAKTFKNKNRATQCGICHKEFLPENRHDRFCLFCKEKSDLFKFANWMEVRW